MGELVQLFVAFCVILLCKSIAGTRPAKNKYYAELY